MPDEPFDELRMYTIYCSPRDHPGKYVVRGYTIGPGGEPRPDAEPLAVVEGLRQARAVLPEGLTPLPRDPRDHISVVESWF